MRTSRWVRLVPLLCLVLATSGCMSPTMLGKLEGFNPGDLLDNPAGRDALAGALNAFRSAALKLTGALLVLLCFHSAFKAFSGQVGWPGYVKDWLMGAIGACLFMGASVESGPARGVYEIGQELARAIQPQHGLAFAAIDRLIQNSATVILHLPDLTEPGLLGLGGFFTQAPALMLLVTCNCLFIYFIKMVLQVAYTFLLFFYWMLTPLMALMLILPGTRHIFWGWLKSLTSIALWPVFFAAIERLLQILPWDKWTPLSTANLILNGPKVVELWFQTQFMLVVLNFVFLGVYLSVPVVANKIVTGATSPFRTSAG